VSLGCGPVLLEAVRLASRSKLNSSFGVKEQYPVTLPDDAAICIYRPSLNQYESGELEICDIAWPYVKETRPETTREFESYRIAIREALRMRPCILCRFSAADASFTEKLFLKGIALVQITRALHLGCAAKYISLLNEPGGELISRLSYFGDLIEQIVGPTLEPQNWALIEVIMAKYELGWCVTYLASAVSTFKLTCREAEQVLKLSIDRVRALSNERKLRELTEDQALRLSCITRTFCAAERSRGLMAPHWFTTPNSDQVFAGQRPIDRMSTDDLEELETICRRVRSLAGY
jgi:hypothetical protein